MQLAEIRAIYDREQRRDIVWPDSIRTAEGHTVRHVTQDGKRGFVLYSALTPENADREIAAQLTYFRTRGIPFEWKLFSHDQPADLRTRLARQGIATEAGGDPDAEIAEAVMVLDLTLNSPQEQAAAGAESEKIDVRRLETPAELTVLVAIEEAVWGRSFADLGERLGADMVNHPEEVAVYIATVAGVPAAVGWIYFHPGTQFASIWGGSTLPTYRGRGLYRALLATRAHEARRRGFRFLTVDAGPMSKPILERHGFVVIAYAYPCTWEPATAP